MISQVAWARLLAVACTGVLCGILVAALWPFNPHPRNNVTWLGTENGVRFGGRGTILSAGEFAPQDPAGGAACSLEIRAQAAPGTIGGTLLGFYSPANPVLFYVRQYKRGVIFERNIHNQQGNEGAPHLNLDTVFHPDRPSFIAMTAGAQGTATYLDGVLVDQSSRLGLSCRHWSGRLVLGNSPVDDNSWRGTLRGLAIYSRELSAAEVLEHFRSWTANGRPAPAGQEDAAALYLFDERAGNMVHNRAGRAPDMVIPDHYLIAHKALLEVPWKEFKSDSSYVWDVLVNVAGFVPFGFVFCAYFASVRRWKRAQLVTILMGFALSLTIETLQYYIPSRGSGLTDVITNTLGTALGASAFGWRIAQAAFSSLGIPLKS